MYLLITMLCGYAECFMVLHVCRFAGHAIAMDSALSSSVCSLLRIISEPWPCTPCCPAGSAVAMDFFLFELLCGWVWCFMVCMSAVSLNMLLLWSPHSMYQFAARCASSMCHGFAGRAVCRICCCLVSFLQPAAPIEPWLCTFCCPAGFAVFVVSLLELFKDS